MLYLQKTKAEHDTIKSFDYQWRNLHDAPYLFGNESWRTHVDEYIVDSLSVTREWIKHKTVIDVGCGDGRWSYGFVKLGCAITSVDISQGPCRATKQNVPHADVIMSDLHSLPSVFDKKRFDIVWCYGVIHHVANPLAALKALISMMHAESILHLYVYCFDRGTRVKMLRGILGPFSLPHREAIIRLLIKTGLAHGWSVHELFDELSTRINHEISENVLKEWFEANSLSCVRYTPQYAKNLGTDKDIFVTGSRSAKA